MTSFLMSPRVGHRTEWRSAPHAAPITAPMTARSTLARPAAVVRAALVVADDPATLHEAAAALAAFPDAEVKCATTLAEAEWLVRRRHFDLALVDVGLPDGAAVALIQRLASAARGMGDGPTRCVACAALADDARLTSALAAGAHAYVLTGDGPGRLGAQVLAAARGESAATPAAVPTAPRPTLVECSSPAAPAADGAGSAGPGTAGPLSPRETEVLRLVARGLTIAETAGELGVSENTVKAHVKRTYAKLDVRTRVGAAREARRLGLLNEEDDARAPDHAPNQVPDRACVPA